MESSGVLSNYIIPGLTGLMFTAVTGLVTMVLRLNSKVVSLEERLLSLTSIEKDNTMDMSKRVDAIDEKAKNLEEIVHARMSELKGTLSLLSERLATMEGFLKAIYSKVNGK